MYKLNKPNIGETESRFVVKLTDNAFIPFDPANTDYQAFLLWKSQGNEPLPADDPQP